MPRLKVVEINHPLGSVTGAARDPANVPLSAAEEEYLVSAKLESAVSFYNEALTTRLEQNRIRYEARLEAARRSSSSISMTGHTSRRNRKKREKARNSVALTEETSTHDDTSASHPMSLLSTAAPSDTHASDEGADKGPIVLHRVVQSLMSERAKLQRQTDAARGRRAVAEEGKGLMETLNHRIEENLEEWRSRAWEAERKVAEAEEAYRREISQLEHSLRETMSKMERVGRGVGDANTGTGRKSQR